MIAKLILSIFLSASFRTANIQPNPTDYEYAFGMNGVESSYFEVSKEQENGEKYNNLEFQKSADYYTSYITYKEARTIDSQSFGLTYPMGNIKVGMALNSRRWQHGVSVGLINYNNKYIHLSFEFGNKVQVFKTNLSYKHQISKRVFLEPMLVYNSFTYDGDVNTFWQSKIRLGFEL